MPTIPRGLPTHLAPRFHKRNPSGGLPASVHPANTAPGRGLNHISTLSPPTGLWQMIKQPVWSPTYPMPYFLEFQKDDNARLTKDQDLLILSDELSAVSVNQPTRVVFELPCTRIGKEVIQLLIDYDITLNENGGKFVYYFPLGNSKIQALQDLGLIATKDKIHAASLASAPRTFLPTSNPSNIVTSVAPKTGFPHTPDSGTWQVLGEPVEDQTYKGTYFTGFQKPNYTSLNTMQDIGVLTNEIFTACSGPNSRIVFEHSDTHIARDVIDLLLGLDILHTKCGGTFVHYFPTSSWTNQAQALEDLHFKVTRDRDDAIRLAQTP